MRPYRPKATRGLVAGRFDPLHRGHEHLVEVARRSSEELDVVVFTSPNDAIPGDTRVRWLQKAFPGLPVYPAAANADFAAAIRAATKGLRKYEIFYGSEIAAGLAAANAIGATFVPVDPAREAFRLSSSDIRSDPMKWFGEIARVARPWFVRRVAVVGPESTGKTELCRRLAHIYSTRFVPEPARALAAVRGGKIDPEAIELWARTQMAAEDSIAYHAQRVLFADTDVDTVTRWSARLFDQTPPEIEAAKRFRDYDLRLICQDDVAYVGSPENDDWKGRRDMFNTLAAKMARDGADVLIQGTSWEQRLLTARKAVDQLLAKKGLLSKRGERLASGQTPG